LNVVLTTRHIPTLNFTKLYHTFVLVPCSSYTYQIYISLIYTDLDKCMKQFVVCSFMNKNNHTLLEGDLFALIWNSGHRWVMFSNP